MIALCDAHSELQLPDASRLVIPTRSTVTGDFITTGSLHHEALQSILVERPLWYKTFLAAQTSHSEQKLKIVSCGPEKCVPPSLLRDVSHQVVHIADLDKTTLKSDSPKSFRGQSENDIAVVGMSCQVPGADDLEAFWELLCKGESQHQEVASDRFDFETPFRDVDPARKWFGNFIADHDKFDHKFFKKSPREMASTDPQQRLFLQIAYQAVQQSGYFRSKNPERRVGCYVAMSATDYEANIACHGPNAFSATGKPARLRCRKSLTLLWIHRAWAHH